MISLGLFKDQADIESSPVQTYSSDVRPGDIKYKDVNGDGVINDDDIVPLSYSNTPTLQYGFAAEFRYKQFTASIFFEGVGKVLINLIKALDKHFFHLLCEVSNKLFNLFL